MTGLMTGRAGVAGRALAFTLTVLAFTTTADPARAFAAWIPSEEMARAHLTATPDVVLATCARLAKRASEQQLRMTIFCPPAVPAVTGQKQELAGGLLRYRDLSDGYMVGFHGPPGLWADDWGGHWTFAAGTRAALAHYLLPQDYSTTPPTNTRRIAGMKVRIYRMPADEPAFYAGHVISEWKQAGRTFHLSVHGHRWAGRLRVMTKALVLAVRTCTKSDPPRDACSSLMYRSG